MEDAGQPRTSTRRWPRRSPPHGCVKWWPGRSILGGNVIVTDYEMAKVFADAEAIYSYEGTHEINTLVTGRAITGISAIV